MANYYLDLKHSSGASGKAHADYVLGENKYNYKDKEVEYVSNNLPDWATTPQEFWDTGDTYERLNGRVYSEIKVSLPNELELEKNIELIDEFVENSFNKEYYYTVAIHDKESSYEKGTQNIHAHIMFSTRKIDEVERPQETFFRRANNKNPEKGGCPKDVTWYKREKLLSLRKEWEVLQNNYLKENGNDVRVSCETLVKQKEEALNNGDTLKAELLDREPINIEGYILNKKDLTEDEKETLEVFNLTREIKTLKEEIYIEKTRLSKEQDILTKEKEILKQEEGLKSNLPFSNVLDIKNTIELVNFEIEKTKYDLNRLDDLTIKAIAPKLFIVQKELSQAIEDKNIKIIPDLEIKEQELKEKIDPSVFEKEKNLIKGDLDRKIEKLNTTMAKEETKYDMALNSVSKTDFEEYKAIEVGKDDESSYFAYLESCKSLDKLTNKADDIRSMNTKEKIEVTALNILTKNQYSVVPKYEELKNQLRFAKDKLEWAKTPDRKEKFGKEIKLIETKMKRLETRYTKMKETISSPSFKNKKIRIEKSIESKLDKQLKENIFKQFEVTKEIKTLKPKIDIITNKLELVNNKQDELRERYQLVKEKISLVKEKVEYKKPTMEDLEAIVYDKISNNRYSEMSNEYHKKDERIEHLEKELINTSKLNFIKISSIKKEISELNTGIKKLENEYHEMKSAIPEEKLFDMILETQRELKANFDSTTGNSLKNEEKELYKELKSLGTQLNDNKDLIHEFKNNPNEFEKQIEPNKLDLKSFTKGNHTGRSHGNVSFKLNKGLEEDELEL